MDDPASSRTHLLRVRQVFDLRPRLEASPPGDDITIVSSPSQGSSNLGPAKQAYPPGVARTIKAAKILYKVIDGPLAGLLLRSAGPLATPLGGVAARLPGEGRGVAVDRRYESFMLMSDLLELVQAHATFRFVISDQATSEARLLIWIFNPSIKLSYRRSTATPLPSPGRRLIADDKPKCRMCLDQFEQVRHNEQGQWQTNGSKD
jgi:hypothetical protein